MSASSPTGVQSSTHGGGEGGVVACGCPRIRKYLSSPGKVTCFQPYKSLYMCQICFPLFTSSLIHMYKWRCVTRSGGTASLLSVSRFLVLSHVGTGRHVCSCFNTAVYVWILRQAGFIRHGVWRKHRIVPWRTRAPCVGITRRILFERLSEVQVFLQEGKRDVFISSRVRITRWIRFERLSEVQVVLQEGKRRISFQTEVPETSLSDLGKDREPTPPQGSVHPHFTQTSLRPQPHPLQAAPNFLL